MGDWGVDGVLRDSGQLTQKGRVAIYHLRGRTFRSRGLVGDIQDEEIIKPVPGEGARSEERTPQFTVFGGWFRQNYHLKDTLQTQLGCEPDTE